MIDPRASQRSGRGAARASKDREQNVFGLDGARSAGNRFADRVLADGVQLARQRELNHYVA
jgi:hypothetical protein